MIPLIEVYGKENCIFCTRAKNLLNSKGLFYRYIDAEKDEAAMTKIRRDGAKTFPAIYIDDRLIGGFEQLQERLS